jgi:uncharacterized membrane protein YeaQ/YmgE (transglycosylase-associated protein family)
VVGFIGSIIIGLIAGWATGMIMKGGGGGYGIIGDLVLGLIGGLVGGWLTSLLLGVDLTSGFNLTSLLVSIVGAVVVVAIYRLITRRSLAR